VIVGHTVMAIGMNDDGNAPEVPTYFFNPSSFFLPVSEEDILAMSDGDKVFD
jgi:hypothetical protein